jgi:hypothetical protein
MRFNPLEEIKHLGLLDDSLTYTFVRLLQTTTRIFGLERVETRHKTAQ